MKTYTIQASEVAALIGKNVYCSVEEAYLKFMRRHDRKLFYSILEEIDAIPIETHTTNMMRENNVLNIWFYKAMKAKDTETLQKCFTTLEKITDKEEHPKKEEIYQDIKSRIQMRRGNTFEADGIQKYEKKYNRKVTDRNSFMYEKTMKKTPEYTIIMKAKIDGIDRERDCLIEHKNRVRCLKQSIPEHEKIQLEIYMHLTKLKNCRHVQTCFEDTLELPYVNTLENWKQIKGDVCYAIDKIHILYSDREFLSKFINDNRSML